MFHSNTYEISFFVNIDIDVLAYLSGFKYLPIKQFNMSCARTWGRYSYRTVVGPAKAGLFKEEAKESEENEEKRVGSWQLKIK